jgi:hypothetical protein
MPSLLRHFECKVHFMHEPSTAEIQISVVRSVLNAAEATAMRRFEGHNQKLSPCHSRGGSACSILSNY